MGDVEAADETTDALRAVRRLIAATLADGLGTVFSILSDDVVIRLSCGQLYLGPQGLTRGFQERSRASSDLRFTEARVESLGRDWVLVRATLAIELRDGQRQAQPGAWLMRVRERRLTDWLYFRTAAEARAAVVDGEDPRAFDGISLPADPLRGLVEDLGSGYVLVAGHPEARSEDEAMIVLCREARPVAGFRFPSRREALAAIPPSLAVREPAAVADEAISAFLERDIATIVELFDEDFVYTDEENGIVLEGGAANVNRLLLIQGSVKSRGLPGLRITVEDPNTATISGRSTRPSDSRGQDVAWEWATTLRIEGGRIVAATRRPNRRIEAAG